MTKKNEKKHDKRDSEKVESSIASVPSSLAAKGKNVTLITGKTTRSSQFLLRGKSRSKTKLSPSESRASDAPNRGSLLLDWVRRRMSFISEDDNESSDEEEEIQQETKEKKKKGSEQSESRIDKREKEKKVPAKQKKKKQKDKGPVEQVVIALPRPPGMTDDIISLLKERKEAKRIRDELEHAAAVESSVSTEPTEKVVKIEEEIKKPEIVHKPKVRVKMSAEQMKAEKDKAAARVLEKLRKQEEAAREQFASEERRKQKEQTKRLDGLMMSLDVIKLMEDFNRRRERREMKDNYWKLYVECGDLPIVNHISDMTMYLHSWRNVMIDTTPEDASSRTKDSLKLLKVLDHFIEDKPPKSARRLENYKWLRESFRLQLKEMMEAMTFKILKDVDKNMNHITLSTGDFNYNDDRFKLSLWLKFQMPKPLFNPRKPLPPPISLKFSDIKMSVDFPPSIDGEAQVFRMMYLIYDHLSDSSRSFSKPPKPEYYSYNLVQVLEKEWRIKKKYKILGKYRAQYEQELQKHEINRQEKANYKPFSMGPPPPDLPPLSKFELPEVDSEGDIPEIPPTKLDPTPEEYSETLEEVTHTNMKQGLLYIPEEFEINLRKYIILGGLHIMNLFYQPPQPQHLVTMILNVTTFVLPKELKDVPFYEPYRTTPPSDEQKTPEELESLLRLQEEGFAKLISVTLTFPTHIMYLEPPVVCMWEETEKIWSTRDIHDVKQNEEKGTVSFRTGKFGIIGLATFRYANLPYQTWEIKPNEDGSILFQLNAAIIMYEFKIKGSSITVTQFQNGPNNALQDIISKTFRITKLKKILREGGVDIFPDYDAFCYVEGSCEKHWPTEYICYYNMAQLAICYNFAWSRWNATEGYRSIVMQMRIFNPELQTQKPHNVVLVTPLSAAFINCTEVTPLFCKDPLEGSKFCCNLWYLMKSTSTIYVRNKIQEISQETTYTLAQLLIGTRILSFS